MGFYERVSSPTHSHKHWTDEGVHVNSDVQIYRNTYKGTGDLAWNMGATGNKKIAVAAYHDGSEEGAELIKCIEQDLQNMGTKLFVFKWKNQEIWLMQILHRIQSILGLYKK